MADTTSAEPVKENDLRTTVLTLKSTLRVESAVDTPSETLLRALKDLHSLGALSEELLRETKIGITVNRLAKEDKTSEAVREEARKLVDHWRQCFRKRKASTALSPEDGAAQNEGKSLRSDPGPTAPAEPTQPSEKSGSTVSGNDGPPLSAKLDASSNTPSNQEIAALFKELSDFEFKKKEKFKGIAYKKVAEVLKNHEETITSGKLAAALPGVGKESAKKIDELLTTGSIERLEKYRRGEFD